MTTVVYKTVEGHEILADVHAPTGEANGAAILYIHGGALIMGSRRWITQALKSAYTDVGFSVISIDYRLAPETKLPEIVSDLEDAHAWVRHQGAARFGFDPEKICVVGSSAGGYLTLLAGARLRPRPRALVAFYGYGDLTGPWYAQPSSFYNSKSRVSEERARAAVGLVTISEERHDAGTSRGDFYLYCRQRGVWPNEVGGHAPSEAEWFRQYEPLHHVSPAYPPTLLLHGEADTDVPFEQSLLMAEQLTRHGVHHELVTDPAWDHGFDYDADDPKVQKAIEKAVAFAAELT